MFQALMEIIYMDNQNDLPNYLYFVTWDRLIQLSNLSNSTDTVS